MPMEKQFMVHGMDLKKHSALERLSCLTSVFSTFERSLFHDPLNTLALEGMSSARLMHSLSSS